MASMDLGFEFYGVDASVGVSASYETALRTSISQVATRSTEVEHKTTCTAEGNEGSGFWQWVVRTSDGSVISRDVHTVCKSGPGFNQPPECPWNACVNGDCSVCRDGWSA